MSIILLNTVLLLIPGFRSVLAPLPPPVDHGRGGDIRVPHPEHTFPSFRTVDDIPVWDVARVRPPLWPSTVTRSAKPNKPLRWVVYRGSPPGIYTNWCVSLIHAYRILTCIILGLMLRLPLTESLTLCMVASVQIRLLSSNGVWLGRRVWYCVSSILASRYIFFVFVSIHSCLYSFPGLFLNICYSSNKAGLDQGCNYR